MLPGLVSKIQRLDAFRLLVVGQYCGTGMMVVVRGLTDLEKRVEMVAFAFFSPLQNSEWASLGPTFWISMGPLAIWGAPFEKWALSLVVFFPPFLGSKKAWNLENTKIIEKTPNGSTKNGCCSEHVFLRTWFLPKEKVHIAKIHSFKIGPSSFLDCVFYHQWDVQKKYEPGWEAKIGPGPT